MTETSPMTFQQGFDKVWDHFITNRNPPSYNGQMCRYRGPNGEQCGFAVLVPDHLKHLLQEGVSAAALLEKEPRLAAVFDLDITRPWPQYFQDAHDLCANTVGFALTALHTLIAEATTNDVEEIKTFLKILACDDFHARMEVHLMRLAHAHSLTIPSN